MARLPDGARKGVKILLLLCFAAYLGYSIYRDFHHEAETLLACEFTRPAGAPEFATPKGNRPIGKLRIEARVDPLSEPGLLDVSGSATWPTRDEWRPARASGYVGIAPDKKVETIWLHINYPGFRGDDLSVSTLNSEGELDRDRSRAFLYFGREDRLAFPVSYACRIDRREAHWGWS